LPRTTGAWRPSELQRWRARAINRAVTLSGADRIEVLQSERSHLLGALEGQRVRCRELEGAWLAARLARG
jgi:hypothetical protein